MCGCHNPETWNPNNGIQYNENDLTKEIIDAIAANNIQRNLSILGGEPLDTLEKIVYVADLIKNVKKIYPDIKICLWTGYYYKDIAHTNNILDYIFENIDFLIEGPFEIDKRDITLKWRGSRNQRIINLKEIK